MSSKLQPSERCTRVSQKIMSPILLPPNTRNFRFFILLKTKIKINLDKRSNREGDYLENSEVM
jgi:hypothetical protein